MSKKIDLNNKTIVISRTDSIGDVILSLPLCGWLKEQFPSCKIIFLGRDYTKAIVSCYTDVDQFASWDDIENLPPPARSEVIKQWKVDVFLHVFPDKEIAKVVKKAKVPYRIGTSHRAYHLLTCNIRPNFTRKNAEEHESQLNFHLLKPYGVDQLPTLTEVARLLRKFTPPKNIHLEKLIGSDDRSKAIVLHPKSKGSALEWHIDNYMALATLLANHGFTVFLTGTDSEGASFRGKIPRHSSVHDVTGKMKLTEFIAFLAQIDTIVACSTGPLHIAGALGKKCVGLYPSKRPMHPGRWQPIGGKTALITDDSTIEKGKTETHFLDIAVEDVYQQIIAIEK